MDRPHHERLATAQVARGKHAFRARHVVGSGLHVAPRVEFEAEVGDRPLLLRAHEAHRKQRELAGPFLLCARQLLELLLARGRILIPLDPHGLQAAELPLVVAHELLREDAEFAAAALLVRRTRPQHLCPEGPRAAGRPLRPPRILAEIRRLREQLELRQALRALAIARAVAVAPGVTAADHDHVLALGHDLAPHVVAGVALVLLWQELHRVVHARKLTPRDRQVAAERGAAGEHDRVILFTKRLRADIGPDIHAAAELDSLGLQLLHAPPDPPLLELEIGDAIHEQPARPVGPLEHRDEMAGAIQLLRCGQSCRSAADDGHPLARPHRGSLRHHPALVEGPVGDRHLDLLDRDGILVDAEHARRLARRGADAAGELGEVVGGMQPLAGLVPLLAIHEVVEVGNDVPERAAGVAEGHAAIHAAGALRLHLFRGEDREKLVVVLEAVGHRGIARHLTLVLHESARLTH